MVLLIVNIPHQVLVAPVKNPWSAGSWERAPPAWGEGRQRLGRSAHRKQKAENSTMDIYDMLSHRAAVICDNQHVAVVAKKRTQDS